MGNARLQHDICPLNPEAYISDYRRRIQKIIAWLKVEYPEHHDKIVFDLTDMQRANTNVYYNATQDIRYDMLHHHVIQCFISANKTKANGKHYQYDHLRKYHDAILYCSKLAKLNLPNTYKAEMKSFLDNLKKEKTQAKICNGFLRLAVLLVRARRRAADRLYCPGGTGYEQCREEFYNHATITRSNSRMHQSYEERL